MNDVSFFYMNSILQRHPVQPGFHVLAGSFEFIPVLQDLLVQFIESQNRTLLGATVGPLYWIDSGNRFDVYQMAQSARQRHMDPSGVLRAVRVARPFTAFQYQQMLEKIPEPLQVTVEGQGLPQSKWPLVIISDLMGLFYDPDIQEEDVKRAGREFLTKLLKLKRRAIILSLLVQREVPPHRAVYFQRILDMADTRQGLSVAEFNRNKESLPLAV